MSQLATTHLYSPTYPISLRTSRSSDAPALSKILSNPENIKNDPMCSPTGITEEQASSFIARTRENASADPPKSLSFVLVVLPSIKSEEPGEVIGLGGFGGIDELNGRRFGDVGMMIEPEFRGKGYALEALRLSIDFAFGELGVDGVTATSLERNEAMVGLLEKKMGWAGERRDGKFGLECSYRMYPQDWREIKENLGWE